MASADEDFTAFADAASGRLLNTAYLLCGDWHTAEDLTQTTLAKVYAAWHRIGKPDAVFAYARRTLLNTYFVDCRRTRRREVLAAPADLPDRPDEPRTPELRLALTDALATLPPRARAIVVLRYWEDMSVEQVATQLDCSTGTVKSQSSRSLDKLRLLLGATLAEHGEDVGRTSEPYDPKKVTNG